MQLFSNVQFCSSHNDSNEPKLQRTWIYRTWKRNKQQIYGSHDEVFSVKANEEAISGKTYGYILDTHSCIFALVNVQDRMLDKGLSEKREVLKQKLVAS